MSTKAKVALVLGVLLVALTTWRVVSRPTEERTSVQAALEHGPTPPGDSPGEVAAEAVLEATPAREAVGGDSSAAAAPTAERFELRVTADVVDEAQRPLPDARVAVVLECEPYVQASAEQETSTDERGRAELALDLPASIHDSTCRLAIEAGAEGRHPVYLQRVLPADGRLDLGTLRLAPFHGLRGTVVDARGAPLAGVWVRALRQSYDVHAEDLSVTWPYPHAGETRTDDHGAYHLDRLDPGRYRLWAGDGRHAGQVSEPVSAGADVAGQEIDFVLPDLPPEMLVGGLVTDRAGTPLAGMRIELDPHGPPAQFEEWGQSDAEGRFTFATGAEGRFDLRAVDPDGELGPTTVVDVAPGDVTLHVRLAPARRIAIAVQDESGEAVLTYRLTVRPEGEVFATAYREGRHEDGTVTVNVPDRPYVVSVGAPEFELAELGPFAPERATDLDVTLHRLELFRGRVTAGGEPVANARVTLFAMDLETDDYRLGVAAPMRGHTDADGRFALPIQFAAEYGFLARAEGFAPTHLRELRLQPDRPEEREVELGMGGAVEGRVRVPVGEEPAGRAVVFRRDRMLEHRTETDAEGNYRIEGLSPGPWMVEVLRTNRALPAGMAGATFLSDTERAEPEWDCEVREGETTILDLAVESLAELTGTFRIDGEPAGGLGLRLYRGDLPWFSQGWQTGTPSIHVTAEPDGSFTIEGAEPGRFWLIASVDAGALEGTKWVTSLELQPGANRIDPEWTTTRVSGRVPATAEDAGLVTTLDASTFAVRSLRLLPDGSFEPATCLTGKTRLVRFAQDSLRADPTTWPAVAEGDLAPGVDARLEP